MKKPKIEIEWDVEPALENWFYELMETFEEENTHFTLKDGKFRAEKRVPIVNLSQFDLESAGIFEKRFLACFSVASGQVFRLKKIKNERNGIGFIHCESRLGVNEAVDVKGEDFDTKEDRTRLAKELLNRSKIDSTLRNTVNYFYFSLVGSDQLAVAGNLYMAMEEVKNNEKFGTWDILYRELETCGAEFSPTQFKALQEILQNGRHAYYQPREKTEDKKAIKSFPLRRCQLDASKKLVRALILAYIEWLKQNR